MRRAAFLVLLALLVPTVAAHAPRVGDEARAIGDPTKSWAFYETLPADGMHAYTFDAQAGDRLQVLLYTPADASWTPRMSLVGPDGVERALSPVDPPRVVTEGFTPHAMREVASLDVPAPQAGAYTLVVEGAGGAYGFALGSRESFTAQEWLGIPISAWRIHLWEGQPALLLALPYLAGLALGALLWRRRGVRLLMALAGGLFAGSAIDRVAQAARATALAGWDPLMVVALVLGALALLLAIAAWRARRAWAVAAIAVAGLALWAGLLVGPLLAMGELLRRAALRSAGRTGSRSGWAGR